jgi:cholesterol transport system auxiliary component
MRTPLAPLTRRSLFAGSTAILTLGGCGSLLGPSGPPPQIYRLQPDFPTFAPGPSVSWQLAVARPVAAQALETDRIALLRGAAMDYYAAAQWNDSVPRLVQSLLVEAFERSGRILAVARESEGVRADYTLETEIRDFDAQYTTENGAPTIVVDLMARLLGAQGAVVASHDVRQSQAASANSVVSVVQTFDQALGAALGLLVTWSLQVQAPAHSESR